MARPKTRLNGVDVELAELPPELRWREYMGRVEAVIFAAPEPVSRETLARVVGRDVSIEAIIDDIRAELKSRPYELVTVASGWRIQTRTRFADAIRVAANLPDALDLSPSEHLILTAIAYFQPATRRDLSEILGRDISRDTLGRLRATGLIASGPRSPRAGAPS